MLFSQDHLDLNGVFFSLFPDTHFSFGLLFVFFLRQLNYFYDHFRGLSYSGLFNFKETLVTSPINDYNYDVATVGLFFNF